MSKAILFFADGLEECEGLLVVDLLRRAGITVQTVSVSGRAEVTSAHNVTLRCDAVAETADLTDADAVVLPGGMPGTTHLAESALVARTVRSYAAQGKLVAAICAAPSVLGGLGLLQGKRATVYPGFEDKLTGATLTDGEFVTDGNIVTACGLGAAIPFALELIRLLEGDAKAAQVRASIGYRH
ncbi:MAG: DJ-1 family glyoxalase III [Oscillospiraceae bacterium]|nr:DJ-1 family glyoxalase III [Oscillospiraceae bacterium]